MDVTDFGLAKSAVGRKVRVAGETVGTANPRSERGHMVAHIVGEGMGGGGGGGAGGKGVIEWDVLFIKLC